MNFFTAKTKKTVLTLCLLASLGLIINSIWIPVKAKVAQHLLHAAWEKSLEESVTVKPWPWFDFVPVAELVMPKYRINQIVLSSDAGGALAFGPGENSLASKMPQAAKIISGHRDTHFEFLRDVEIGDEITLNKPETSLLYEIEHIEIVDSNKVKISPTGYGKHLILVTCYPFDDISGSSSLRYVVLASQKKVTPSLT